MLFLALAFASCHRGERQTLRSALQMAYADPDSALAMLHTIDRRSLPPEEKAYYALTYYLAQNKEWPRRSQRLAHPRRLQLLCEVPQGQLVRKVHVLYGLLLFIKR